MKHPRLWMAGLAVLSAGMLPAQDVTGTWQGMLTPPGAPKGLRIVMKISKDAGALKAAMYSIDQAGGQAIPAVPTQQGANLKIAVAAIAGTYEGKLSADGNLIDGNWSQGGPSMALKLAKATPDTEWTIPDPPVKLKPMAKDANLVFEVATIKPSRPDQQGKALTVRGREFITLNTNVSDLLSFAYGLHAKQIVGAPAWFETEKFDIVGKPEAEGQPNATQLKVMLQKLLAERFGVVFHKEKKDLSVYAITMAKAGSKLTKSTADPDGLPGIGFRKLGGLIARNATLEDFAGMMQGMVLDRPVVNQSGLNGKYDFQLDWTPDPGQFSGLGNGAPPPAPNDNADAPPDLFAAMQQQLGLKLEATKAAVDVWVIDKAEKPGAN